MNFRELFDYYFEQFPFHWGHNKSPPNCRRMLPGNPDPVRNPWESAGVAQKPRQLTVPLAHQLNGRPETTHPDCTLGPLLGLLLLLLLLLQCSLDPRDDPHTAPKRLRIRHRWQHLPTTTTPSTDNPIISRVPASGGGG